VSPNSATPVPPGTGPKRTSGETPMLITSSSESEMPYPRPRANTTSGGEQHFGGEVPENLHRLLA